MERITVNPRRTARVAELLNDFRTLQYWITEGPKGPVHPDDYYAAGWVELRQCLEDGKHILDCAADITVPMAHGGPDEQVKAQLQQHEAQKIYNRTQAALTWVAMRDQILAGGRPHAGNAAQLMALDQQLWNDLALITDEAVYEQLRVSDIASGRWTGADPNLYEVQCWIAVRKQGAA
ncbi:uncharacterized protein CTHT_0063930 [Thermochaetoides thermophila DSM 1495]|uniref:Uncharacterized protein n=1 Tax=Chaetomium thermophilum (strain DSM 1495 / CBS 144.50 / IMI 039719) TaxID=759272 RepID=G0SEJ1_CHATD|nr:hypothetical protein CTHT_0063930 [Thermochaetoides thermophila DSM 1495]EGS18368.1 hypothetical protein CTHT_0063930 [Thermochaetoides thermophila DSM 1495]